MPNNAWLTRTRWYWDQLGTIIPGEFVDGPESLSPFMQDILGAGLLRQVSPSDSEASWRAAENFGRYIDNLSGAELNSRRAAFAAGSHTGIYRDKFLHHTAGISMLRRLGLGASAAPGMRIETRTAAESMAALALTLCHPDETWHTSPEGRRQKWLPITDTKPAAEALLAGLSPEPETAFDRRVGGEYMVSDIRAEFLEELLPVPVDAVPLDAIVKFRERHGDRLIQLRLYLENELDTALAIENPAMRQRYVDRMVDDAEERVREAES